MNIGSVVLLLELFLMLTILITKEFENSVKVKKEDKYRFHSEMIQQQDMQIAILTVKLESLF